LCNREGGYTNKIVYLFSFYINNKKIFLEIFLGAGGYI
jgi:hypothetical protein